MQYLGVEILQFGAISFGTFAFFKLESFIENMFRMKSEGKGVEYSEQKSLKIFKITRILLCLVGALECNFIHIEYSNFSPIFILCLFVGIILRCAAIKSLGEYWSFNIKIYRNHRIIRNGIYKYIQHPAYIGNIYIVCFFALLNLYITATIGMFFIIAFGIWRAKTELRLLQEKRLEVSPI